MCPPRVADQGEVRQPIRPTREFRKPVLDVPAANRSTHDVQNSTTKRRANNKRKQNSTRRRWSKRGEDDAQRQADSSLFSTRLLQSVGTGLRCLSFYHGLRAPLSRAHETTRRKNATDATDTSSLRYFSVSLVPHNNEQYDANDARTTAQSTQRTVHRHRHLSLHHRRHRRRRRRLGFYIFERTLFFSFA